MCEDDKGSHRDRRVSVVTQCQEGKMEERTVSLRQTVSSLVTIVVHGVGVEDRVVKVDAMHVME